MWEREITLEKGWWGRGYGSPKHTGAEKSRIGLGRAKPSQEEREKKPGKNSISNSHEEKECGGQKRMVEQKVKRRSDGKTIFEQKCGSQKSQWVAEVM